VRSRFDLVAFDPRGVGRSTPVRCATTEELDVYFALDPQPDDEAELAALQAGNEELVAGCADRSGEVLPHVSTGDAARDLDRVRAAIGDERLTYLGYSYGTALGAAYLERFPANARAMVLDGGIDPTLTWDQLLEGQSSGFDRALEAFLADCEKTRCAFRQAVRGELGAAYDALAARVETQPLPGEGDRTVGPGEFSLGVGAGLYSRANGWPAIAAGLAQAQAGDGATLLALNDSYLDRGPDGYANVSEANLAVNCIDRPWPRETAPYLALAERVERDSPRFGPAIALSGLACAEWPVEPVGQPHRIVAEGAPPVVVIGTTGDPATPYAWSEALAEQLASGVLVTYRGDGHTVYRAGAPDCLLGPVDGYLLTGKAPEPLTC
jgi:pimeloyl-ACP methyl ester carboxylesterase